MNRPALLLVLLALATAAVAHEPASITTVILVRHAEKADASADPQLSEAGRARAEELLRVVGSNRIDAIYATPYHRTRQTAAPLSAALSLMAEERQPGPAYAAELAAKIRKNHMGQTVVVVGHSNTTQQLIVALGVETAPKIEESTFDNLFIVTLAGDAAPRLLSLRYGAVAR